MKKQTKAFISILLVMMMVLLTVTGCGKPTEENSDGDGGDQSSGNDSQNQDNETPESLIEPYDTIRLNCGGEAFKDSEGNDWLADKDYVQNNYGRVSGTPKTFEQATTGTSLPQLYNTAAVGTTVEYKFDRMITPNIVTYYNVKLYFTETEAEDGDEASASIFDIEMGDIEIYDFSPAKESGKFKALEINYTVDVRSARKSLTITLRAKQGNAMLAGIEITPYVDTGELRVNVGGSGFVDKQGNIWKSDQAYIAGSWGYANSAGNEYKLTLEWTKAHVDPELFKSSRWGKTDMFYQFDGLEAGTYEVTVYLAEDYHTSRGARVFELFVNGIDMTNGRFDPFAVYGDKGTTTGEVKATVTIEEDEPIVLTNITHTDNALLMGIAIIPVKD